MIKGSDIRRDAFQKLRKELLDWQGFRAPTYAERREMGLGQINKAFPNEVFPLSAVHEFISHTKEAAAATSGFMAGILGALMHKGACLWVGTRQMIFPPALKVAGINPDQVIFVNALSDKEALWVIEEGLKCGGLAAVVGEVKDLSFTASGRLQLAVEKSRITGLIHRNIEIAPGNTACLARWKVTPLASVKEDGMPGVGFPSWRVELIKIRNGRPGAWQVQWMDKGFVIAAEKPVAIPGIKRTG